MNFFLLGPCYKLQVNLFFFLLGREFSPNLTKLDKAGLGPEKKIKKIINNKKIKNSFIKRVGFR